MPDERRHRRSTTRHVLAVDIGGTKMEAAVVDGRGELSARTRIPTRHQGTAAELAADLDRLVVGVLAQAPGPVVACGVGCGGPMSRGGDLVSPLNIGGWRDYPLREHLSVTTGCDVYVDNDAKALALAEGWRGAAAGATDYLAMVVSTGVGGGIVVDGRLLDGASGNAGHIGHVIVVPGGQTCECGARGCLEAEASGSAIAAITGRPAREADVDTRRRTGTLVGRAVASVANLLDVRLAAVAGSVALGFGEVFFESAAAELERSSRLAFSRGVRMVPGALGDAGPLVGAAAVAWRGVIGQRWAAELGGP